MADDFDVVVLGAGSAGEALATELAEAGVRVAVVEEARVGGTCPYLACMPSKALLRAVRLRRELGSAVELGATGAPVELGDPRAAWAAAVRRRDAVAAGRDDHEAAAALEQAGAVVIRGHGELQADRSIAVGERVLRADTVVLATGSEPVVPDIPGLTGAAGVPYWTSEDALASPEFPERLLVLGAGPVGCELASVYAGFGCRVTVLGQVLPREDPRLVAALAAGLRARGVELVDAQLSRVEPIGTGVVGVVGVDDAGRRHRADRLLLATGRRPRGESPATDARCRVAPGLYAVGDLDGQAPFTHTATHHARVVAADILGRGFDRETVIPRAVYTDPPLVAVGLTEAEARQRHGDTAVRVATADVGETARALVEAPAHAPVSGPVVAVAVGDRLVGAGAVAPGAEEWLGELALAIRVGIGVAELARGVHPFPSFAEILQPVLRELAQGGPASR